MVDKSRNSGRGGGARKGPAKNSAQGPGRSAGKPGRGPAGPRQVGGVDANTLQFLQEQGLLSKEGRQLMAEAEGGGKGAKKADKPLERPVPPSRPVRRPARPGKQSFTAAEESVAERLHKVMARSGVASRRHSEELIQAGRVKVNGQVVTELGMKVIRGKDLVEVDGRPLGRAQDHVYILLNKPKNYVTTLFDPQGRPKVVDLLGDDIGARVYPVGRLDFETEGLLLLTNDGDLANALMHPGKMVKKTYIAKLRGVPGPAKLRTLETGVELEDGITAPAEVKMIDVKAPNSSTVSIRIHEGRNRQVRRMFEALGHEVIHLRRTTLGPLHLRDLEVGQWRELTDRELNELRAAAGMRGATRNNEMGAAKAEARKVGARRGAGRVVKEDRRGFKDDRRGPGRGPDRFAADGPKGAPRTGGPRARFDDAESPDGFDEAPRPARGSWRSEDNRGAGRGPGRGDGAEGFGGDRRGSRGPGRTEGGFGGSRAPGRNEGGFGGGRAPGRNEGGPGGGRGPGRNEGGSGGGRGSGRNEGGPGGGRGPARGPGRGDAAGGGPRGAATFRGDRPQRGEGAGRPKKGSPK